MKIPVSQPYKGNTAKFTNALINITLIMNKVTL